MAEELFFETARRQTHAGQQLRNPRYFLQRAIFPLELEKTPYGNAVGGIGGLLDSPLAESSLDFLQ